MTTTITITTVSGRRIDLRAPDPRKLTIEDIAHSLSMLCRYSGNTRAFWSVAQHSVLVAALVPVVADHLGHEWRPGHLAAALLHDAEEMLLGDITTPVKAALRAGACTALDDLSAGISRAVEQAFGIHDKWLAHPLVKAADALARDLEIEWGLACPGAKPSSARALRATANAALQQLELARDLDLSKPLYPLRARWLFLHMWRAEVSAAVLRSGLNPQHA